MSSEHLFTFEVAIAFVELAALVFCACLRLDPTWLSEEAVIELEDEDDSVETAIDCSVNVSGKAAACSA